MSWPGLLLQLLGGLLVALVLVDVFFTVLFPASGHGPIRKPLSKCVWRAFATLGGALAPARRRRLLAYSGPLLITVTILTWVLLLVLGWAAVFKPALGRDVVAANGPTDTGWGTALYVSGFSLSTLGTGDVVPTNALYRLLTVAESALGFSVFTMVLTYFLSIYGAITSRKTFASSLHHHTFDTGHASQLLAGLAEGGSFPEGQGQLAELAGFLTHTFETHRSYPVLRYFHFRQQRYALPRLLLIALDAVALMRCALDNRRYATLVRSPVVFELSASAQELLAELVPEVEETGATEEQHLDWAERFRDALQILREGGLEVIPDERKGAEDYIRLRDTWDRRLRALADAMIYDWDRTDVGLDEKT